VLTLDHPPVAASACRSQQSILARSSVERPDHPTPYYAVIGQQNKTRQTISTKDGKHVINESGESGRCVLRINYMETARIKNDMLSLQTHSICPIALKSVVSFYNP